MEDNVLFTPRSLNGTCDAIAAAGDFDYLALAVKRPLGTPFRPDLGLREVKKARVTEPMPNVWMSSYLVTGNGAVKLLGCLKRQVQNYGSNIIDRVVSRQCLSGDESIKAFIVDHDRFFGHVETLGDTRIKQNMDAAVHHKRYSHIRQRGGRRDAVDNHPDRIRSSRSTAISSHAAVDESRGAVPVLSCVVVTYGISQCAKSDSTIPIRRCVVLRCSLHCAIQLAFSHCALFLERGRPG
ncbi:unnamed protein product [Prorocentrum cordatum]|uniref:Uncharacterized protein n=1 Tax=Prorocentrum cordatum TaxID=2364126 RepID=A0ABN9WPX4_9DINO|nr:unnamed protein product [Polarella glacialis]